MPHTWSAFIEVYLTERQLGVIQDETITDWPQISVVIPLGTVFGPNLYLLYTAEISTNNCSMTAMFADDTAMLAIDEYQQTVNFNDHLTTSPIGLSVRKSELTVTNRYT